MARRAPAKQRTGIQLGELNARVMILQGAARLFSARGVRAPSVGDLLKEARVSRRTFYRLYTSKEDVLVALYRMGTDRLVEACMRAVEEEKDPIKQVERFIDGHLRNARLLGRLVFVLGGEAQRHESALHPRRMEVHATIVSLLTASLKDVDPLMVRAMVLALEGVTRLMLEEGDEGRNVTDAALERVRKVMMRMATSALAGEGPGVTPIPTRE